MFQHAGRAGGADAPGAEHILQTGGDPGQVRQTATLPALPVNLAGGLIGLVLGKGDVCLHIRINVVDALEDRPRNLRRGHLTPPEQICQLMSRQIINFHV